MPKPLRDAADAKVVACAIDDTINLYRDKIGRTKAQSLKIESLAGRRASRVNRQNQLSTSGGYIRALGSIQQDCHRRAVHATHHYIVWGF